MGFNLGKSASCYLLNPKNRNVEDIKIIQDTRILQNIIGRFPDHGNQINVFYITSVGENGKQAVQTEQFTELRPAFDFESFLESLPQPRLKNLIKRAVSVAMTKFNSDAEAGKWLGGSRTIIGHRRRNLLKEEKEDEENTD